MKKLINANVERETYERIVLLCSKYNLVQKEIAGEMIRLGMDKFIEEYIKGLGDNYEQ